MSQSIQSLADGKEARLIEQDEQRQYLTFDLRGEMFAIGILHIKEILEYGQLTTVPMMPDFIRGVINLRGTVVPVVDIGARFGGTRSDITKRTCIVILEVISDEAKQDIGVVVDSVSEVLDIPASEIEPTPAFGANIRADFIAGMGKVNGKFVIILNVDAVLSGEELGQWEQVATGYGTAQLPGYTIHVGSEIHKGQLA